MVASYVPYHEPAMVPILVLSSFLYLANVARFVVDKYLYAGLLGEIAVGIIYGSPLTGILDHVWEEAFLALGYLGLLLIVFEGGLSTPLDTLFASLPLAITVALTGIAAPIVLSLALLSGGFHYSLLESFAAGAALSSTSLGTTFTVLRSAGGDLALEKTRIGTVLAAAAVFDDVIGFVLSSIIRALGETTDPSALAPWTVARPLVSSFLYIAIAVPLARFALAPVYRRFLHARLMRHARRTQFALLAVISALSLGVAITGLIGSSPLLGVYVVGLVLSYLPPPTPPPTEHPCQPSDEGAQAHAHPFHEAFETFLLPLQSWFFSPLFFASIGTAIPFLSLWSGRVIWRGILYSLLMLAAKLVCGAWIVGWDAVEARRRPSSAATEAKTVHKVEQEETARLGEREEAGYGTMREMSTTAVRPRAPPSSPTTTPFTLPSHAPSHAPSPSPPPSLTRTRSNAQPAWLPAAFLALALCARGEIGLLIAQVGYAEAGLLSDEAFLVALWAILLNTVVGPIATGLLVKRYGARVKAGRWA